MKELFLTLKKFIKLPKLLKTSHKNGKHAFQSMYKTRKASFVEHNQFVPENEDVATKKLQFEDKMNGKHWAFLRFC